ncbi:EF-P beta-lysylation protein EpmB, partial [Xanthomonas sp. Kuri4-2]
MITAAPLALQPSPPPALQPPPWQQVWREAVRDPRELLALLGL